MTDTTQAPERIWLDLSAGKVIDEQSQTMHGDVEYIRADLAPDMAAIVKPLVWKDRKADSITGLYTIVDFMNNNGRWCVFWECDDTTGEESSSIEYSSDEEAMAAVEAIHQARILSAITLRPAAEIRNKALEEAANVCDGEIFNMSVLTSLPQKSSAAFNASQKIRALKFSAPKPAKASAQADCETRNEVLEEAVNCCELKIEELQNAGVYQEEEEIILEIIEEIRALKSCAPKPDNNIVQASQVPPPVRLIYKNYRGEVSVRTITPGNVWFGATEWHPERQWLLSAFDHDKKEHRDFALRDFCAPKPAGNDTQDLFNAAMVRAEMAMKAYPQPNYVISKAAEEAGEVVKAAIHCAEGRDTKAHVVEEITDAMAMLIRLYLEGDQVHGLAPLAEKDGA